MTTVITHSPRLSTFHHIAAYILARVRIHNPKASAIRIETIAQGKPLQVTQPINDRQFTGEDGFMSESDSDIRQMLEYLKTRYKFRYNMLEYVPEMKILAKPNYGWLPLDAQRFNSILPPVLRGVSGPE